MKPNLYEGMFIINPKLDEEKTTGVVGAIQEEITKNGGGILEVKRIGKQQLSYTIKKCKEGYYLLVNFEGAGDIISKIQPKYRLNEDILRVLILKRKPAPGNRQPETAKEAAA